MWAELKAAMAEAGWAGVDTVEDMWNDDFRGRHIVSGFLKDAGLGKKRPAVQSLRQSRRQQKAAVA